MIKLLGILLGVLALRFLSKGVGVPAPAGAPAARATVASPSGGYKSATIPGQGDMIAAATGALSAIGGIVGSSGVTSSRATLTFVPGPGDFVLPGTKIFGVVHFYKPPPDGCQGEVPVEAPPADWDNPPIGNFYDEKNLTLVTVISSEGTDVMASGANISGFPCARVLSIKAGSFVNPFVPGIPPIPTTIIRYTF